MSYGFVAKNGNNDLIIDGESSAYRSLQIKQTGTSSGYTVVSHSSNELVFATRTGTGDLYSQAGTTQTTINGATAWFVAGPPSTYTGTEDFGLKVFNQSNVLAYDSRVSSSGFQIDNIFPAGTISGYRTGATGTPSFTTGDIIFSGSNPSGIYVSMQGGYYYEQPTSNTEVAFGCYRFEQTNSRILFVNFFDASTLSAGVPSFTSVILASLVN